MIKLLSILSILIYKTYSQSCGNSHAQSTFFTVSIHGKSVSKIGETTYIDIIKTAAERIIPTGGTQRVGLQSMGGTATGGQEDAGSGAVLDLALDSGSSYADIETKLTNLPTTHDFSVNYANSLTQSLEDAMAQSWAGQKYHIVFAAGNPLSSPSDTTKPINVDLPCEKAVEAKQNNMQTYVALIGAQGINFVKQFYTCAVEDPLTDIIVIDPTDPATGIQALYDRVCKTNGIDFKITEVNPVGSPFIEVFNRGASVTISVDFGGSSVTCGTPVVGAYCSGSLAASAAGSEGWTATATGGGFTNSVTHDGTKGFQNQVINRPFALRAEGFNNQYGLNWRSSCGNTGGTPGTQNLLICDSSGGTCDATTTCSATSPDSEPCNGPLNYCICLTSPSNYWGDADTCIDKPTVETLGCVGYTIRDWRGDDYTYFAFNMEYDGEVSFTTTYNSNSGEATWDAKDSPVAVTQNVLTSEINAGSSSISVQAEVASGLVGQTSSVTSNTITCTTTTMDPSKAPTSDPSKSPSDIPTQMPSSAPTHDAPGVYLGQKNGMAGCGLSRCSCVENVRGCCQPFGPQYGETMTSGIVPDKGCPNMFKNWEITSKDQKKGLTETIWLSKYGDNTETTIYYRIRNLGQINSTTFENLTVWTNYSYYYDTTHRRRLQTATPAPTTEFGNKLNIEVVPPGDLNAYIGQVTIADGAESAQIGINVSVATLKCKKGQDCTTYDECAETSMAFNLEILNCTSLNDPNCEPLYPTTLWISVKRDNKLCSIIFGMTGGEDELPDWFWWVLIALIVFLLILAWLVYRFWWKQKKTAAELGDAEDELDQQQADNEQGFGKDLDVGDVAFNPMATGVPGMNRPADAFGNELHQRQLAQQNDMVDVQAEIFQVRQDYGQVQTDPRHHNQGH